MEPSMRRAQLRIAAVLAVLALLMGATACSGGDDGGDAQGDVLTASPDDGSSSSDGAGSSGVDDVKDALDQLDDGPAGDCFAAGLAYFQLVLAPVGFMGGATDDDIEQLKADAEELRSDIPDEIRDDFETYADGIEEYADAMRGVSLGDIFDPDTQQAFEEASQILDTPEMQEANDNIEAYFERVCPESLGG